MRIICYPNIVCRTKLSTNNKSISWIHATSLLVYIYSLFIVWPIGACIIQQQQLVGELEWVQCRVTIKVITLYHCYFRKKFFRILCRTKNALTFRGRKNLFANFQFFHQKRAITQFELYLTLVMAIYNLDFSHGHRRRRAVSFRLTLR